MCSLLKTPAPLYHLGLLLDPNLGFFNRTDRKEQQEGRNY